MLSLIGIGKEDEVRARTGKRAYSLIQGRIRKSRARELEQLMVEHGFSGSIVHSPEAWRHTSMGLSLSRHPLINYTRQTQCPEVKPAALPRLSDRRPLAGVKVVELVRIIAGSAVGAALASKIMGAEVIRVNSAKLEDYTPAQASLLMAGKMAMQLNLDDASDRSRLRQLFEEADVILQGYRLRSLDLYGFGLKLAPKIAHKRGRGMVYVDENCYGPDGVYAERRGKQQVADAAAGSSYVMGRAFGCLEGQGVLPSLPISDMSTGIFFSRL